MSYDTLVRPSAFTTFFSLFGLTTIWALGRLWDFVNMLVGKHHDRAPKGYAPIRDAKESFYIRRMYGRLQECYNRPICSAPDAWVNVMERKNMTGTLSEPDHCPTGNSTRCLNLASYNYLGFAASDPYCTPRVVTSIEECGISTCSSRANAGTMPVHQELESLVADFLGVEAAITYGMGFATNSSTIPTIMGKGCLVLSDALNHASIVAGVRLSGAKVKVFRHNDPKHLEALLRHSIADGQPRTHRPWKKVFVIVEGIYSMEGEACNLKEIVQVAKRNKAYIYLDEAHSIGALGKTGRGVCEHAGVDPRDIDIMMGTFTKSFGSCGGYIAGKKEMVDYISRHSPAHLYACAMAPGCVRQVVAALQIIMGLDGTDRGQRKIQQLHDNANYVRKRLLDMGLSVLGSWDSPVAPIMTYHNMKKWLLSTMSLKRGLAITVVGFPATPLLMSRARICISAAHTREDLEWALDQIAELADVALIRYRNQALRSHVEAELQHFLRERGEDARASHWMPSQDFMAVPSLQQVSPAGMLSRAPSSQAAQKASKAASPVSSKSTSPRGTKAGKVDSGKQQHMADTTLRPLAGKDQAKARRRWPLGIGAGSALPTAAAAAL